MTEPLLRVSGLSVEYELGGERLPALRDVSFEIASNEVVGLVGESGCGKSTVAMTLLGLLPANGAITGGSIGLRGRELVGLKDDQMRPLRGSEIAMVFQDPASSLNPTFTIGQQIVKAAAAHPDKVPGSTRALRDRAVELLAQVGIPDPATRFDDYPHQFSGGMKQRILIAMALMLEPAVLIADEATSALDVTLQAQILELLLRLRQERETAILFVTHDLGVVAQVCDRVTVMYAGRVAEQCDVMTLFERPQHPYTQALIDSVPSYRTRGSRLRTIRGRVPSLSALPPGCSFADRCEHVQSACRAAEPALYGPREHLVRCLLVSEESDVTARPRTAEESVTRPVVERGARSAPDTFLSMKGLSTHFGGRHGVVARILRRSAGAVRAVDEVDLALQRGEVLGLVGESGSGKTTLGLTVLRLVPATEGEILLEGTNIRDLGRGELRRLRRRMQIILQNPYTSLSPRMRVEDLLTEPYRIHDAREGERFTAGELLELVRLPDDLLGRFPHELSGGQARRVSIARALALRPELLIADEPTSGLDISAAASVLNLMNDLRRELALTYLVITHDLNVVGYIADRIAVMYLGQLVEVAPAAEILEEPIHPYTQGLLEAVPEPKPSARRRQRLLPPGEIPSPLDPPPGCRFHTRCRLARDICRTTTPPLERVAAGRQVACHFWEEARAHPPDDRLVDDPIRIQPGQNHEKGRDGVR